MDKSTLSALLDEVGNLLEIKGENPFKSRAYRNAARIVETIPDDLEILVSSGHIKDVEGIGAGLAEKITEWVQTGRCSYYEELKASLPAGLLGMLRIQGVGPKKVQVLYAKLHVCSVDDLEKACRENRLVDVEGFGQKTQDNILKGIQYLRTTHGQFRMDEAQAHAAVLLEEIGRHKAVIRSTVAGSLRRRREVIRDIDLLVSSRDSGAVMEMFVGLSSVRRVLANGETKSSVLLEDGIQADLRVVRDEEYPFALHYFTGSKEHNIAMRARAQAMGMKLNEYGLFKIHSKQETLVSCKDEQDLFKALNLDYIEPELREDQGEIDAAEHHRLPNLVTLRQIRGAFHVHTVYSDGAASVEDVVRTAAAMGWEYLGIADHSQHAHYAGGLSPQRLKDQAAEVDAIARRYPSVKIFKGVEADILGDGVLDYDERVLASLDFVIAAVHDRFNLSEKEQTARLVKAVQNKHTTVLAHPTGRLLLDREAYPVNMKEVIDAAAVSGTMIELNANPHRLDLDWRWCRYAREKGVLISINPDAHKLENLRDVEYGVGIARKGWLEAGDVFNTFSLARVVKRLAK